MLLKFKKGEIFSYNIFEIELLKTVSSQPRMEVICRKIFNMEIMVVEKQKIRIVKLKTKSNLKSY